MKYLKILVALAFTAGLSTTANALTVDATLCDSTYGTDCTTTNISTPSSPAQESAQIESLFGLTAGSLSLLYKSEEKELEDMSIVVVEDGTYAGSYTTTYSPVGDPDSATISLDPGATQSITCPECYLYVKDGNADPNVYIFNLGTSDFLALWNGTEALNLVNFWNDPSNPQGAISHVAIYGVPSPIPVPAAVWLFGTALIGFIGISRRTEV